jgi:GDP-D-mannose 3',5'-epimerase
VPALSRGLRLVHARRTLSQRIRSPWNLGGGREKARAAAICRKVIEAKASGRREIEIWGSGNQTRTFMYIDDCIERIQKIMDSDILEPINLGSSEIVTVNQLVDIVEDIADVKLKRRYNLAAPKGVNGRNSDNTLIQKYLSWEPSTSLRAGLQKTYAWIYDEYMAREISAQSQSTILTALKPMASQTRLGQPSSTKI